MGLALEPEEFDEEPPPLPSVLPLELPVGAFTTVVEKDTDPGRFVFVTTTTVLVSVASPAVTEVAASVENSPLLKLRQKSAASEKTSAARCQQRATITIISCIRQHSLAPTAYPHRWYTQLNAPASM